jgi:hypothetical protein
LIGAAGGAALFGIASAGIFRVWWPVISILAGAACFAAFPGRRVELLATRFEFTAKEDLGRRSPQKVILLTADIRALEFRTGLTSRGDGLYVVTNKWAHCLLPNLDSQQTGEVVEAIEKKFPGLAEAWQLKAGTSERFLTGGLGKTGRDV